MKRLNLVFKMVTFMMIFLCFVTTMFAQNIELKPNTRGEKIEKSTLEGFTSTFSFSEIESVKVSTEKGEFSVISMENTVNAGEIGFPSLPISRELIAVPFGASPVVKVVSYSTTDYNLSDYDMKRIYPQQPMYRKDTKAEDIIFHYNEKAYNTRSSMGKSPEVTFEILGTMRGVQLGALQVEPVDYNPSSNTIRVYNDIKVEVVFENADVAKTKEILRASYSPYFDVVYDKMLNNKAVYDVYKNTRADLMSSPVKMLVIANRMFETALQPWIQWKTEKGFYLDVQYTDVIGTSATDIQAHIQQKYEANKPTFVVIVGDEGQVAPSIDVATTTSCVSDLYYASVDGDVYPDMYHSRMSCETTQELINLLDKTLQYEQYTMPDPSYLANALLIAGVDATYNPMYGQPQVNYAADNYFNAANGFENVYKYLTEYDGCYDKLNSGVGMINYTAHGFQTRFSDPRFSTEDVINLTNKDKYFWAMGNCCLTGDWGYDEPCLGEALIRGNKRGSWGYIGSCPNTYWQTDYFFAVGINGSEGVYDALWQDGSYSSLSSVTYLGNMAVAQGGYYVQYYFEAYHTLGDGSVMPYMAEPTVNNVSHSSLFPLNQTTFNVSAAPGSYVGITKDGVLLGAGLISETGTADIPVTSVTTNGEVKIVVSHPKHIPYVKNISARDYNTTVSAPTNFLATLSGDSSVDLSWNAVQNAVSYNVYNEGKQIASGITSTNYSVTNLEQDTDYCFSVSAVNNSGESLPSVEECVHTPKVVVDGYCLVDFVLNDSCGDGWDDLKITVGFNDGTPSVDLTLPSGSTVTHTLEINTGTDVAVSFPYAGMYSYECSFIVQYQGGDVIYEAEDPYAGHHTTFTVDCGDDVITPGGPEIPSLPSTPTNVTATATGENTIALSWNSVQEATSYNVYNAENQTTPIATNLTSTTYTVTGLSANTQYCYQVTAVNSGGESAKSSSACATTDSAETPVEPQVAQYRIKDTGTNKYITIFNHDTHTTGPVGGVGVADYAESNSQIFTLEQVYGDQYYLKSADGYYIKHWDWNVDAIDGSQCSSLSGFDFNGGTFKIMTSKGYFKVELVSGAYHIFSNATSNEAAIWVLETTSEPEIPSAPSTPTNVTATATGENTIALSWNSVQEATSYNVYRENEKIASGLTSTTYTDENLIPETQYCYKVTAVNAAGESSYSTEACAMTDAEENPDEPEVTGNCLVDFVLNDKHGDGWQVYHLQVEFDDGTPSVNIYFKDQLKTKTETLEIAQGTTVTVSFIEENSGFYSECSYHIQYHDSGDIIYTSENPPAIGHNCNFVVDCGIIPDNPDNPEESEEIVVGNGTSLSNVSPFSNYYHNSWVEMIYPQSEIGGAKTIYSVSFNRINDYSMDYVLSDIRIYMAETPHIAHSSSNDWISESDLTLVYSGSDVTIGDVSWEQFNLQTPYNYSGENSLVIVVAKKSTQCLNNLKWYCTESANSVLYRSSDNYTSYAEHPGSNSGAITTYRPNIKMGYVPIIPKLIVSGSWDEPSNWSTNAVPNDGANVVIQADVTLYSDVNVNDLTIDGGSIIIEEGVSLTVTGTLINDDARNLIMSDGSQIFQNNADVPATFSMRIINPQAWTEKNKDGWQFISSPFTNAKLSDFTSADTYDLYRYDGSNTKEEWRNYKDQSNGNYFGTTFESGVAYLASYESLKFATLTGSLNASNTFHKDLEYSNKELENFYLIGNPFSFDMDMNSVSYNNLVEGYAVVNNDGGYDYYGASSSNGAGTVKVGDGFFVKAINENPSLSYEKLRGDSQKRNAINSLNVIVTSNAGRDNVVINLSGEKEGFPKMKNFNEKIAKVFVYENDVRYGIYNCDAETEQIDVFFETKQMDNYTISVEADGKFESVILVDCASGVETNVLLEDYSFMSSSQRFVLKIRQQSKVDNQSHFAYMSGNELIIEAQGLIQIFDVMGRIHYSDEMTDDKNRIDLSSYMSGTYMVRVVDGDNVRTEKIVVY